MKELAREVMDTKFHTLREGMPVSEAVRLFRAAGEAEGRKMFGMMVIDDEGRLVGMLSMYDILLFIRPKHIHIWGMMEDVDISGMIDSSCAQARTVQVAEIMTPEVVSVTPDTKLLVVLDIMLKKHIRRMPVIEDDRIQGIIYISDLFYHVLDQLT